MSRGKDYTRICNRCGGRWLLPKTLATESARSPGHVKALERNARLMPVRGDPAGAAAARSLLNRVMANAQCPHCGSSDYRQYKPGKEPPDDQVGSSVAVQPSATPGPPPPPPSNCLRAGIRTQTVPCSATGMAQRGRSTPHRSDPPPDPRLAPPDELPQFRDPARNRAGSATLASPLARGLPDRSAVAEQVCSVDLRREMGRMG